MIRYKMLGRQPSGEVIELFTWVGDLEAGLRLARREAKRFGFSLIDIWAKKVEW